MTGDAFNNVSALYWYLFVFAMCKTWYQYIARAPSAHIVARASGFINILKQTESALFEICTCFCFQDLLRNTNVIITVILVTLLSHKYSLTMNFNGLDLVLKEKQTQHLFLFDFMDTSKHTFLLCQLWISWQQ